jgi:integrase/recombinase XerD
MTIWEYLQRYYTKKTAVVYLREINNYLANNTNPAIYSYAEIVQYIGVLRTRYPNPKTLSRILSSIKAYYNYLCLVEIRKDNPSKSILLRDKQNRDVQLQDLFTSQELERLLTAKKERYFTLDYRNKVLMSLLIYQALKPNEVESLTIDEVNLEQATIYIKPSSKTNSRTLELKASQILLFKKYVEEIRPKLLVKSKTKLTQNQINAFIIGQRSEPMTAEDITKHVKRNYDIYKPRRINALTIRQSVITNLLKQNNDLRIVQTFAGHKYPSTTERYKQSNVEALQTALQIYHPFK